MACPLLRLSRMVVEAGRWCPLTPDTVSWLGDDPGVFEVANLVRSVVYVGRGDGSLRERLTELAGPAKLPPAAGGHYFRYTITADEETAFARLLEAYRSRHGGFPPRAPRPRQACGTPPDRGQ